MQAYKPYVDYIMAGGVAESAYILTKDGQLCGTNLPIQAWPKYEFDLEDENDPNVKHKVVVDEGAIFMEALNNKGVAKSKTGIRIYNQKYYTVRYDEDSSTLYLRKQKGGACVIRTRDWILIGTFNTQLKMENGVPQNQGQLNKRVDALAADFKSKEK